MTGNITITGSNYADKIGVILNGTSGLRGNLSIYGENGNDTITVDGTSGTESIYGNAYIDGGYGDDQIYVGGRSSALPSKGLVLRGNLNQIIGGYGNDSFFLGNNSGAATTTVGGSLAVYSTQKVDFEKSIILGSQLIELNLSPSTSTLDFAKLNVTYNNVNSSLISNSAPVTINGGDLGDSFLFEGGTNIGTTTIKDGAGNNSLDLEAVTVNGNFSYAAGNGNNTVTVATPAIVRNLGSALGDLNITLGNGQNTYNLNKQFHVAHNLNISFGNDSATLTIDAIVGTVSGPIRVGGVSIKAGTGANNVTMGPDALFGTFVYSFAGGGNLNDVTFDNAPFQRDSLTTVNIPVGERNLHLQFDHPGNSSSTDTITSSWRHRRILAITSESNSQFADHCHG